MSERRLSSVLYDDFHPFYGLLDMKRDANEALRVIDDPKELEANDILILWGGGDISPKLYNQHVTRHGGGSEEPNRRDRIEWACLQRAIELKVPIIGVCRGAQMLCAAAGGYLIQHVDNHAGNNHMVKTAEGEEFQVNSLHHQMMYPFEVDNRLLAWSSEIRSDIHETIDGNIQVKVEPELVVFPKIKGIAAQWHPEAMRAEAPATQYLLKIINEVLEEV